MQREIPHGTRVVLGNKKSTEGLTAYAPKVTAPFTKGVSAVGDGQFHGMMLPDTGKWGNQHYGQQWDNTSQQQSQQASVDIMNDAPWLQAGQASAGKRLE